MNIFHQWAGRLAWVPVAVLAAAMAALWIANPQTSYESPGLLLALNVVFTWLVSLSISFLAARSFLINRQPGLLMFGCGTLLWGLASMCAAALITATGNQTITVHNLGALGAALCHLCGFFWRGRLRQPGRWLAAGYSVVAAIVAFAVWAATTGHTPVFFVEGQGGTIVRQIVLGSAIGMFALASSLMLEINWRRPSAFLRWYGMGLTLLAAGLAGVMLQSVHGGLLGWTGRITQYLGGAYLFIAAAAAAREAGTWKISLAAFEEAWRRKELLPSFQNRQHLRFVLRYGSAVVAVALAFGLRQLITTRVGPGIPPYLMFAATGLIVALFSGFGPAMLALLLTDLVVAYWILPPAGQFYVESPADRLGMLIYSGVSLFFNTIVELYRRNRDKAAAYDRDVSTREIRERLATFAEATFEGIVESESGRILDCNEQFARMLGYSMEEMKGMDIARMIAPEDLAKVAANIRPGLESVIEHTALRKDGSRIVVEAHGRPIFPGSKRRHTAIRDITARKRAEEELRVASDKFLKAFHGNAAAMTISRIEDGRILDVNERWLELVGARRDEVIGKTAAEHGRWKNLEDRAAIMRKLQRDGTVRDQECTCLNKDGEEWVALFSAQTIVINGERVIISSAIDITARKRAEEELRRRMQELERANADLARFNRVAVGRELRMIELKKVVNDACRQAGQPVRYALEFERESQTEMAK